MWLRVLVTVIINSVMLWTPSDAQYDPNTRNYLAGKMTALTRELVADAEVKITAVQHYRDQYYRSLQYQLGQMVYDMRNKFKRMVVLFQLTNRNISYWYHNHNENLPFMLEMHHTSMEIENVVMMIQEWQKKREDKDMFHTRMNKVMRTGREPDHELDHKQLDKLIARVRESRGLAAAGAGGAGAGGGGARRPEPGGSKSGKKKNKKWRHISDDDFV